MYWVADQMPKERPSAVNDIINRVSKKQKRAVVIALQADSGKSIVGKPELNIIPAYWMDKVIVDYPIIVVPKKPIVQVKGKNKKTDRNQYKYRPVFFDKTHAPKLRKDHDGFANTLLGVNLYVSIN